MNRIAKRTTFLTMFALYGVPFTYRRLFDGWQIEFPWTEGDIACHEGTGYTFETYNFYWDRHDVTRFTNALDLATRITTLYLEQEH